MFTEGHKDANSSKKEKTLSSLFPVFVFHNEKGNSGNVVKGRPSHLLFLLLF
jgi:hypothetical protein